jgi:hypothetical protein
MTTTFRKREKEKARQERAKEKADDRVRRKVDKPVRAPGEEGEDPDLAGIVPGPQPIVDDY